MERYSNLSLDDQLRAVLESSLGSSPSRPKFDGSRLSYDYGEVRFNWRDRPANWAEGSDGNWLDSIEIPTLRLVGRVEWMRIALPSFAKNIQFRKNLQKIDISEETRTAAIKLVRENNLEDFDAVEAMGGSEVRYKLFEDGIGGRQKLEAWINELAKDSGEDPDVLMAGLEGP